MKELPIPAHVWEDILEFLTEDRHGNVRLNVKDGQIVDADFFYKSRRKPKDNVRDIDQRGGSCAA